MHKISAPTELAWTDESRERCVNIMFYIRAGVGTQLIVEELDVPPLAVKQVLLLYRSEKGGNVRFLLTDLGIEHNQIAELRRNYMRAVLPVLWQRELGAPMTNEERRALDTLIEFRIPPDERVVTLPPVRMPRRSLPVVTRMRQQVMTMTSTLPQNEDFLKFGKKVTSIERAEQERVFQYIESIHLPHCHPTMQSYRDDETVRIKMFATQLPEPPTQLIFRWHENTRKHCLSIYLWLSMGASPKETAREFNITEQETQRIAAICLLLAGKPLETACQMLGVHRQGPGFAIDRRKTLRDIVRDFIQMRGRAVIAQNRSLSWKDSEHLRILAEDQMLILRDQNWRMIDDEHFQRFESEYRTMLWNAEEEVLKKLLCTAQKKLGIKAKERKLMRRRIHERLEALEQQKRRGGRLAIYELFLHGAVKPPQDGSEDQKWHRIDRYFKESRGMSIFPGFSFSASTGVWHSV
jgi:hypothetical protein